MREWLLFRCLLGRLKVQFNLPNSLLSLGKAAIRSGGYLSTLSTSQISQAAVSRNRRQSTTNLDLLPCSNYPLPISFPLFVTPTGNCLAGIQWLIHPHILHLQPHKTCTYKYIWLPILVCTGRCINHLFTRLFLSLFSSLRAYEKLWLHKYIAYRMYPRLLNQGKEINKVHKDNYWSKDSIFSNCRLVY